MRAPREHRPESGRDELLLDAVLGEGARRAEARARLAADADGREELRDFEERVAAGRRELRAVKGFGPGRERALVAGILARTTRADAPAPRVSALRRHALALAAASVALAGAAVALRTLRARDGVDPATSVRVADLRPVGGVLEVLALARAELETTATAARRPGVSDADAERDSPLELRLLQARAKGLRERRWDPWLVEVPLGELSTLALALWCEVQLDRFVLTGTRPPAWKQALDIAERGLAPDAPHASGPQSSRLLAHALARARDYGWSDGGPARAGRGDPLWTGEWFSDLEAAGREAGLAESGTWRAWIEWRGM